MCSGCPHPHVARMQRQFGPARSHSTSLPCTLCWMLQEREVYAVCEASYASLSISVEGEPLLLCPLCTRMRRGRFRTRENRPQEFDSPLPWVTSTAVQSEFKTLLNQGGIMFSTHFSQIYKVEHTEESTHSIKTGTRVDSSPYIPGREASKAPSCSSLGEGNKKKSMM